MNDQDADPSQPIGEAVDGCRHQIHEQHPEHELGSGQRHEPAGQGEERLEVLLLRRVDSVVDLVDGAQEGEHEQQQQAHHRDPQIDQQTQDRIALDGGG